MRTNTRNIPNFCGLYEDLYGLLRTPTQVTIKDKTLLLCWLMTETNTKEHKPSVKVKLWRLTGASRLTCWISWAFVISPPEFKPDMATNLKKGSKKEQKHETAKIQCEMKHLKPRMCPTHTTKRAIFVIYTEIQIFQELYEGTSCLHSSSSPVSFGRLESLVYDSVGCCHPAAKYLPANEDISW